MIGFLAGQSSLNEGVGPKVVDIPRRLSGRAGGAPPPPLLKVIQDRGMSSESSTQVRRRPQWRGERKAVLVRMPVKVADRLARSAKEQQRSVSDQATLLIDQALAGGQR